ncbi:MAG: hypothetical protein ACLP5H_17385 [Desulfomonilaceae bacterium]
MASLRQIQGESLAEKNRIRSLVRKGAALCGMTGEQFLERVETDLRERHIILQDAEGGRSQIELALSFLCTEMEQHRNAIIELASLFGISEDVLSTWPPLYAKETLERAKKHGCAGCKWLKAMQCLRSEEDDHLPEECPEKELVAATEPE